MTHPLAQTLILTVTVEDYFHGRAFAGVIDARQWPRFEDRVERNTYAALDLLGSHNALATFFFPGWIARRHPELVRDVARRGHEIAARGGIHSSFRSYDAESLTCDAASTRELLEDAAGMRVYGFRAADHRLRPRDLAALPVLARCGYRYDSSANPALFAFHQQPWRRTIHRERIEGEPFWEVPLSSVRLLGADLPVAGGNWFRQLPEAVSKQAVRRWVETSSSPFVMYFRIWDLDPDQPVITGAPRLSRFRHYRNPERVPRLIESFLSEYRFQPVATYLQLKPQAVEEKRPKVAVPAARSAGAPLVARKPVTLVVPCYNERAALPYLANTLESLRADTPQYQWHFVFVDDGSADGTDSDLVTLFGGQEKARVVRHEVNQGVAAAIQTGIREAETEIVCSADCDCTYDPHELANMIPMLGPGVDLVTASPYHAQGKVERVPRWRLALSKSASALYRHVLRQRLATYTSCFRVYRRSAVLGLEVREKGFLGVAELLGVLDLNGGRVVEYPATLHVRMLGQSKMKVLRTIAGHLKLIRRLAARRWLRSAPAGGGASGHVLPTHLSSKGMERE